MCTIVPSFIHSVILMETDFLKEHLFGMEFICNNVKVFSVNQYIASLPNISIHFFPKSLSDIYNDYFKVFDYFSA